MRQRCVRRPNLPASLVALRPQHVGVSRQDQDSSPPETHRGAGRYPLHPPLITHH